MKNKHIMVHVETVNFDDEVAICSVGAVSFELPFGTMSSHFQCLIDLTLDAELGSSLERRRLRSQGVLPFNNSNGLSTKVALNGFNDWLTQQDESAVIWCVVRELDNVSQRSNSHLIPISKERRPAILNTYIGDAYQRIQFVSGAEIKASSAFTPLQKTYEQANHAMSILSYLSAVHAV